MLCAVYAAGAFVTVAAIWPRSVVTLNLNVWESQELDIMVREMQPVYRKVYKSHVAENSVNFPGTAVNRKHGTAVFQIIVNIWEDAYANIKQIVFS